MIDITIPFSFLTEHNIVLSAGEISFGINKRLIQLVDLNQLVNSSLFKYPDNEELLDLALNILLNESRVNIENSNLNLNISIKQENLIKNKWRYIILLWLFEDRDENSLDYDKINTIYADFNYPQDMEKFINYMPAQEKNNKLGYQNIVDNWKEYLDDNRYLLKF